MVELVAYTDGACSGNPGPGGWGVVLVARDGDAGAPDPRALGRRGDDHEQPDGADRRRSPRSRRSTAPSTLTVVTDSVYVRDGVIALDPRLEEERLADRRPQAGEERGPLAPPRRRRRPPPRRLGLGQGPRRPPGERARRRPRPRRHGALQARPRGCPAPSRDREEPPPVGRGHLSRRRASPGFRRRRPRPWKPLGVDALEELGAGAGHEGLRAERRRSPRRARRGGPRRGGR